VYGNQPGLLPAGNTCGYSSLLPFAAATPPRGLPGAFLPDRDGPSMDLEPINWTSAHQSAHLRASRAAVSVTLLIAVLHSINPASCTPSLLSPPPLPVPRLPALNMPPSRRHAVSHAVSCARAFARSHAIGPLLRAQLPRRPAAPNCFLIPHLSRLLGSLTVNTHLVYSRLKLRAKRDRHRE
jgi:hypothetical protein